MDNPKLECNLISCCGTSQCYSITKKEVAAIKFLYFQIKNIYHERQALLANSDDEI